MTRPRPSSHLPSHHLLPTLLLAGITILFLSGCMVGPDYHQPTPNLPNAWSISPSTTQPSTTQSSTTQPADDHHLAQWWTQWNDPILTQLVHQAIEQNDDLHIAFANWLAVHAQYNAILADQYPNLTLDASSLPTWQNLQSGTTANPSRDFYLDSKAKLNASWELDFWGSVRRNVQAANADLRSASARLTDARISIIAQVVQTYLQFRNLQQLYLVALRSSQAQADSLSLVQSRFDAGLATDLEVAQAQNLLALTQAQLPSFIARREQTLNQLSLLTGQNPRALLPLLNPTFSPTTPSDQPSGSTNDFDDLSYPRLIAQTPIPVGLPSDLLRRRPDIRQAEQNLQAATARIGVATADLFPRFFLTGSPSLQQISFFESATTDQLWLSATLGPTVRWSIIDFGQVQSNIDLRQARQLAAYATYEKTIKTALADVENALLSYVHEVQREQHLALAVRAARRALDQSTQLYSQGLTPYLNVLDAQRQLLSSEEQWVQSRTLVQSNIVTLYLALGGGWNSSPQSTSSPTTQPHSSNNAFIISSVFTAATTPQKPKQ